MIFSSHYAIFSTGYDTTIGYSGRAVSRDATKDDMGYQRGVHKCVLILVTMAPKMLVAMIMMLKLEVILHFCCDDKILNTGKKPSTARQSLAI